MLILIWYTHSLCPEPPGYDDLKRAILQRVGRRTRAAPPALRALSWGRTAGPFTVAHQLRDACRRWLLAGKATSSRSSTAWCWNSSLRGSPRRTAQMGPVPPPGVAGPGHPTRRGPDGGVPRGWQNPTVRLSSLSPLPLLFLPLLFSLGPCRRATQGPAPMEGRTGTGVGAAVKAHAREGGVSPARAPRQFPFPRGLHANSLVPLPLH